LAERSVFGDLGRDRGFVEVLAEALRRFERDGVRATVADYVSGPFPAVGITCDTSGETA
jgi:hypothetical protein